MDNKRGERKCIIEKEGSMPVADGIEGGKTKQLDGDLLCSFTIM